MPSITFNGLQKIETPTKYTYVDLHLDFSDPVQRDITVDNDEQAIINSLVNLFNTLPGQNLLNPEYGLNLLQYVFQPATDVTARLIGQTILDNITNFEPRVVVQSIDIDVNTDEQTFVITLSILIPTLNRNIKLPGVLSKTGYSILK